MHGHEATLGYYSFTVPRFASSVSLTCYYEINIARITDSNYQNDYNYKDAFI